MATDEVKLEKIADSNDIYLPNEIIELILQQSCIDVQDLINFQLCCIRFRDIASRNIVWREKFKRRWPSFFDQDRKQSDHNWRHLYQKGHCCGQLVQRQLEQMSEKYYSQETLPRSSCELLFSEADSFYSGANVVRHQLRHILSSNKRKDLTLKYYAKRVEKIFNQRYVEKDLKDFMNAPPECQLLEEGACYIQQWCMPETECYMSPLKTHLDEIADKVRSRLKETSPNLTSTGHENEAEGQSRWTPEQCRTILKALTYVMFTELGFHGNTEEYYDTDNSMIELVLRNKTGNPITMSVIYAAVASRLGVHCMPVNFPSHFLLKFLEHPELDNEQQYTYVDAFNKGRLLTAQECKRSGLPSSVVTASCYDAVPPISVISRMVRNLNFIAQERHRPGDTVEYLLSILELSNLVEPQIRTCISLARIYLNTNINLEEIDALLDTVSISQSSDLYSLVNFIRASAKQQIEENANAKPVVPKRWHENKEVGNSVGQIMKHKRNHYTCVIYSWDKECRASMDWIHEMGYHYTCVIYSWDKECRASMDWIHQMGVHTLPHGQWQPFYGVLVCDGSIRYAAQESLELAEDPTEVTHAQVGKYFSEYTGTYYVPNEQTQQKYPDDFHQTVSKATAKYDT